MVYVFMILTKFLQSIHNFYITSAPIFLISQTFPYVAYSFDENYIVSEFAEYIPFRVMK